MGRARPGILCTRAALLKAFPTSNISLTSNRQKCNIGLTNLLSNTKSKYMYRLLRDSEYDLVAQARQGEPARWRHLPWQVQPGEARWEGEAGRPRQEEGEGQVLHHVGGSKQVHCMLAILFTFVIDLLTSFFPGCSPRTVMWELHSLTRWSPKVVDNHN